MARTIDEWVGKDDDAKPPRTVRARVFRHHEGRCHISKRKIAAGEPWDLEHIVPLWKARPGENLNRESNLAPALKVPHAEKTATEATERAKADRIHAKHYGYFAKTRRPIRSRGFSASRGKG
jgi:5-methylcytosine-specific restriction endonuclease McrA